MRPPPPLEPLEGLFPLGIYGWPRGPPNYTWGLLLPFRPSALGKTLPSESPGGCSPERVSRARVRVCTCAYMQGLRGGGPGPQHRLR